MSSDPRALAGCAHLAGRGSEPSFHQETGWGLRPMSRGGREEHDSQKLWLLHPQALLPVLLVWVSWL